VHHKVGSRAPNPCQLLGKDAKVARLLKRGLVYALIAAVGAVSSL
jgi:hypothetical protein